MWTKPPVRGTSYTAPGPPAPACLVPGFSPASTKQHLVLLTGLLLLAAAARILPLTDNRFHPDEALYARWGLLIATGRDPLLANVPVDKPPLWPYLLAGGFSLFGNSELAARLPAFAASLLSVALTYALARSLWGARDTAILAAALMAFSPYSILFAVTAFTDPLLVLWVLAALTFAAQDRPGRAGLCLGLALATKQTALLFLPLGIGLAFLCKRKHRTTERLARFILGLVPGVVALVTWDMLRHAPLSFWEQSIASYGGLRLAPWEELPTRLAGWAERGAYLLGPPWLTAGLVGLALAAAFTRALPSPASPLSNRVEARYWGERGEGARTAVDKLLAAFVLAFLALHVFLTFNIWDRYLLGLVPVIALLATCGVMRLVGARSMTIRNMAIAGLTALLLIPAWQAAHSHYPIGGDHGAYDGIDQIANRLRHMPWGTVLYDQALNWELGYYLFDGPIYLAWFRSPEHLAEDLRAFRNTPTPRLLIVPAWQPSYPLNDAVAAAGYRQAPFLTTFRRDGQPSFFVYRLIPEGHTATDSDTP